MAFEQPTAALDLSRLKEELPDLSSDVPTKYSNVLHTNYIPSTHETSELASFASQLTSKSSQIAHEILLLQKQLTLLQTRQTFLQDAAAPFQALTSPLRRFPPELMQYIFITCLPTSRNAVMHSSEAPVLLGRVCSAWRRIALNTPALWSSLHIVPPNYHSDTPISLTQARFHRKKEAIEMWLNRSGACPLSLSFVWFGTDGEDETRLCSELLESLVERAKRWRRVEVQMPLKMCKRVFGVLDRDSVPLLESLSLTDNRSNYEDFQPTVGGAGAQGEMPLVDWPEHLQFVEGATNLKNLNLTFFTGALRMPATLPWEQLTSLYLESSVSFFFVDCREMLQTLERCTSLQSCTLKLPLSSSAGLTPPPPPAQPQQSNLAGWKKVDYPITLPELTSLYVDGDQNLRGSSFHMTSALYNIRAPKLKEISILGRSCRSGYFEEDMDDDETASVSDDGAVEGLNLHLDDEAATTNPSSPPSPLTLTPATSPPSPTPTPTIPRSPLNPHSHEPLFGLTSLLQRSSPPLEKLKLESITIFEKELISTLRLVPTLTELVLRDYGARMGGFSPFLSPPMGGNGRRSGRQGGGGKGGKGSVEDRIVRALTVERGWCIGDGGSDEAMESMPASPATSSWTMVEDGEDSAAELPDKGHEEPVRGAWIQQQPLLPSLTDFELAVSFGSQDTFCRFVESRFLPDPLPEQSPLPSPLHAETPSDHPPDPTTSTSEGPGSSQFDESELGEPVSIARLKSVKCTFTAQERGDVKARLKQMQDMGLDVRVAFHIPNPVECFPSPWMGVEGIV